MRKIALVLAVVLATGALAGCFGGDDMDGDAEQASVQQPGGEEATNETNETDLEQEDLGPEVETVWHNGSAQGGSLVATSYCFPGCENTYSIDVEENASAIVVELVWEADAELHLAVRAPLEYCETGPAGLLITSCPQGGMDDSGQSPARVEITDEEKLSMTGEWDVSVWPQDSYTSSAEFTSVASVLYDGQLPPDYTKVEES